MDQASPRRPGVVVVVEGVVAVAVAAAVLRATALIPIPVWPEAEVAESAATLGAAAEAAECR